MPTGNSAAVDSAMHSPHRLRKQTWTVKEVESIWPKSSGLLQWQPGPNRLAYVGHFLATVQSTLDDAYACLRLARWEKKGGLQVTCPWCGKRAWSYSAKVPKHRWRCVTKEMYRHHQRKKGYTTQGGSRDGCGRQFSDTTGTPFERARIPLGLVFLALYLSAKQIDYFLLCLEEVTTAVTLKQVLKQLQRKEHAALRQRMRCFAKLFCGQILRRHHGELLNSRGHRRLMDALFHYAANRMDAWSQNTETLATVNTRYTKVRSLLGKLQRLHTAYLNEIPIDDHRAKEIYLALTKEIIPLDPRVRASNDK